ncbi:MAG: apolipoprotein N-acyltransferase [Pseudomonadota bacterium]
MTPAAGMARPAWQRLGAAALLGAVAALAQAPLGWSWAIVLGAAPAIWLLRGAPGPRAAALLGLAFGFGHFVLALAWIVEPFLVDIARHGWMAPFALVLLSLGMALFWAGAFGLAHWLGAAWMLALTWPLAELARAYIFTGFPWAMLPQGLLDTPAAQALAWLGPHGLMLALTALLVALVHRRTALPAGVILAAALFAPLAPPEAPLTSHIVRVVQPNAPQHLKFEPAMVPVFNQRLLDATEAGIVPPALVVWPEIAIPYLQRHAQPILDEVGIRARGAPVVLGLMRQTDGRYYNSMALLDGARITQSYDKYHLVPFGEYMPLAPLMARLGIAGLAASDLAGFAPGPGPQLIDLPSIGPALPLICYEAVFAHRAGAAPTRPALLLHLTNDAWFGQYQGPQQHFAQARMRAIEQGLPVVRSANTGISGIIDPYGRPLVTLALGTHGHGDHALPAPRAPTLYARTGDLPAILVLVLGTLALTARRISIDGARRRA